MVDLDAAVPEDLVKRHFDTGVLNRVWTSDITYLRTGQGWLYLCAVRDGCSRRVIGWAIDEHMHTDLAAQVILHADRGCPVHLGAARAVRPQPQPGPLSRPHSGMLGQRSARIILGHTQNRVLRQTPMADQVEGQARRRRLD